LKYCSRQVGPVRGDNLSLTRDGDNIRLSMWLR